MEGKEFKSPLVSIITPCYNHEKYLEEYFKSIINQKYKNIELILIDDASNDKSKEIIKNWDIRLKNRFCNYIYIDQKENKGVITNCNLGIKLAKGKYICLFASDDIMLSNNISEKIDFLEANDDYGFVYSNTKIIKNNEVQKKLMLKNNMPKDYILNDLLLKGNFIPALTVVIRKEALNVVGGYEEKYIAEDYQMWLKLSEKYKVGYIKKSLTIYRMHIYSLCNSNKYKNSLINILELKKGFLERNEIEDELRNKIIINSYFKIYKTAFLFNKRKMFFENYNILLDKCNLDFNRKIIIKSMNFIFLNKYIYRFVLTILYLVKYRKMGKRIEILNKINNTLRGEG